MLCTHAEAVMQPFQYQCKVCVLGEEEIFYTSYKDASSHLVGKVVTS